MEVSDKTWLQGTTEMGVLLEDKDWSLTPLGATDKWTPALQTAVNLVLETHTARIVLWGKDLIQIYNDSYRSLLGSRHPAALGQRADQGCSDARSFDKLIYTQVMNAGEVIHLNDQLFNIDSTGYTQSRYTLTYSPAQDEAGIVCGVFVDVIETANSVRLARENLAADKARLSDKRRQAFSLALSDTLRSCATPDAVIAQATKLLGTELCVARALYCEIDEARATFEIRHDWANNDVSSISDKTRSLSEYGTELISVLRSGQALVISDIETEHQAASVHASYAALGIRAFIAIPLTKNGQLSVVLTVHRAEPYAWQSDELDLCQDFVERTWAAAENAKTQATLLLQRNQSNSVFESMTEGFGLIDKDWTVLRMNQAGYVLAQRTAEEVVGKNHWDIWPELKGTPLAQLYEEVKASGTSGSFEYLHQFSNGVATWVEVRAYRTADDGLAFFFRDVGGRRFAEEKLKEADRRKDIFLALLAHELRNPLAPISAAATLLLMGRHDEQRVKKASEIISRQASHMSSLIDDLLDVSRVTRGLIELDKVAINVKDIVTDAVEQVWPLLEARRHQLTLGMSSESIVVLGDHKRLVQVLANLLNNAAKYTAEGGSISITTNFSDDCVTVSVADNGIGMTTALLARAFNLFAQESQSSGRGHGGLGIGLALVKSFVELHGGSVIGTSEGLGTGCRFDVRLPRIFPADTCGKQSDTVPASATKTLRILVVDDNLDAGNTLSMLLTEFGYDVHVAVDGKEALSRAGNQTLDVCILDLGLPDMTGNELAVQMRLKPGYDSALLIAVTGYGQEEDKLNSKAAGFDHHLVKPIDAARLVAILEEADVQRQAKFQ